MTVKPIRFFYNNLGSADSTTVTESGSVAGFESAHAFDSFRFTGWKPKGSFKVVSTNKKIYIDTGSPVTVTLTEATYATGALLAAHVQTQLNASSTNWTCTYSSVTYKFTIGRSSGTALLVLSTTTDAAWGMLGYIGAVDDDVGTGQAADSVRVHTSESLLFDLTSALQVTALFCIGPADTPFSIPATAACTIKANSTNDFASPPLSVSLTPDNNGIFWISDLISDTTYRYWKFEFEDKENPSGPSVFDIRNIYLGDHDTLSRNANNGFNFRLVDPSVSNESTNGARFYRLLSKFHVIENINFEWLTAADRIVLRNLYSSVGNTTPFFVAVDPGVVISESLSEFTKYVTIEGAPPQVHQRYTFFSHQFGFREVVG